MTNSVKIFTDVLFYAHCMLRHTKWEYGLWQLLSLSSAFYQGMLEDMRKCKHKG